MLPIVPIVVGGSLLVLSIAGVLSLRQRFRSARPAPRLKADSVSALSHAIKILDDHVIEDESTVLATEEVPLDNRYGSETVVSEFEFTRSATNAIRMERTKEIVAYLGVNVLSLVQTQAEMELGEKLGFEIGTQIKRSIKLKLAASPGTFARYRITWKQDVRRGVHEVQVGKKSYDMPYVVTYGLCHDVQSLSGSGAEERTEEATVQISDTVD